MSATLAQLTTPLSVADATQAIYDAIAAQGISVTSWKAGSPMRTLVAALAILIAALSTLVSALAKSGFLAESSGDWLTLVAHYVYGVDRSTGTFAAGTVTLTNAGAGVYGGIPAGGIVVKASGSGKTYRSIGVVSIGAYASVVVSIQADEVGSASSAAAGAIDTMVSVFAGVTCSNAAGLVGEDAEDDATLQLRCSEKLGSLSPNGPRDGYAFAARGAKTTAGTSAGVTRVRTIADGIGGVDLYLAGPSGGIAGTVGDLTTALGAADDAVQTQAVPLAITCRTHSAGTVAVDVTYEIWVSSTNTRADGQIQGDVATALNAFVSSRPIGGDVISPATGKVYQSAIEAIVGGAVAGTIKVAITLPAADVSIGSTAAPIPGAYTCTAIHRVTGALI